MIQALARRLDDPPGFCLRAAAGGGADRRAGGGVRFGGCFAPGAGDGGLVGGAVPVAVLDGGGSSVPGPPGVAVVELADSRESPLSRSSFSKIRRISG